MTVEKCGLCGSKINVKKIPNRDKKTHKIIGNKYRCQACIDGTILGLIRVCMDLADEEEKLNQITEGGKGE